LTSPTNTSISSLGLENLNFKFVTLTRAASQLVALFYLHKTNPSNLREKSPSNHPPFMSILVAEIDVPITWKQDLAYLAGLPASDAAGPHRSATPHCCGAWSTRSACAERLGEAWRSWG